MSKYYIVYKKNLRVTPSKMMLEVLRLSQMEKITQKDKVTILGVSTAKFNYLTEKYRNDLTLRKDPDSGKVTCACLRSEGGVNVRI